MAFSPLVAFPLHLLLGSFSLEHSASSGKSQSQEL